MIALLLLLTQVTHQGEGMIVRQYGKKHDAGGLVFNAILCLFSAVFFVLKDIIVNRDGLSFPPGIILYGIISCIMFAIGFYTMYAALKIGSFAITRLLSSFSGIIVILYGILFLKEKAGIITYIAILLIVFSAILMRYNKEEEKTAFSVKWLVYVVLCALSNGFIVILQRMQQIKYNKLYDNEFMIISLAGAFVLMMIIGLIKEKKQVGEVMKSGLVYGLFAGMMNGATNFLNLLAYLYINISVFTPIKTGLGILTSFVISVLLYKEKFTKKQLCGAVLGVIAIVLFTLV